MAGELVLDTGALVSLLDRSQQYHDSCKETFKSWKHSIVTSEAVVTEACHLLSRVSHGAITCLEFLTESHIVIMPITPEAVKRIIAFIRKYHDIPMDYADATLVAIAEDLGTNMVFTLDRRGFETYRLHHRTPFIIVPGIGSYHAR